MNWGNKLVVVFIAFGALIGYLVFRCMSSSVDLVSKDYYKEELAYQEIINGKNNAASLSTAVTVTQESGNVVFCLPSEMKKDSLTGTIWLYCAASSSKDRKLKMNIGASGCQTITAPGSGAYVVKLRWQQGGQEYFHEKSLIVP